MADIKKKLINNAIGEFFVDSSCINCGTCRKFAPLTFGDSGRSSHVERQPVKTEDETRAMQALVACPVHAIGMTSKKIPKEVVQSFPLQIEGEVHVNGFNAESSYGADSYFIKTTNGNWLIDAPRFTPSLVRRFIEMGGIRYIFLTHRDDVADADKYAKARLSIETVHGFLARSSWAAGRTRETLVRSIENSLCFGAYCGSKQVAFARVVTDGCTFSYLCDVFVDEEYRGKGISKALMAYVMDHPDLQSYRRFTLATKDAHELYRKFGFRDAEQGRFMEIKRDGV